MAEIPENSTLIAPPAGSIPYFINPESRGYQVYIAVGILLPTILIFSSIRFYTKVYIIKSVTWVDYCYAISLSAAISYVVMIIFLVQGPYRRHYWDIKVETLTVEVVRLTLVFDVIYGPVIWLIKLSLFLLFLEIFGPLRWLKNLVYLGAICSGLFYLGSAIAVLVFCAPRDGQSQLSYLSAITSQRCSKQRPLSSIIGGVNVASDLFLLVLPMRAVWSLHLPMQKKIGISAILLTGLTYNTCIPLPSQPAQPSSIPVLACVVFWAFIFEFTSIKIQTIPGLSYRYTFAAEVTAGTIIPCMPSVAALVRHIQRSPSPSLDAYKKKLRGLLHLETDSTHSSTELRLGHKNRYPPLDISQKQAFYRLPDRETHWEPPTMNGRAGGSQIVKTTEFNVDQQPRGAEDDVYTSTL